MAHRRGNSSCRLGVSVAPLASAEATELSTSALQQFVRYPGLVRKLGERPSHLRL
jgi:hypothetical protein